MRLTLALWASCIALTVSEDLLFAPIYEGYAPSTFEWQEAQRLGLSAKMVTLDDWATMTTANFSSYKAIVIYDMVNNDLRRLDFLNDSKAAWSPAVSGNVILISTSLAPHYSDPSKGAQRLMHNALDFAASGQAPDGTHRTGLYMLFSYLYTHADNATNGHVDSLSDIGNFTIQGGQGSCLGDMHIVSHSEVMDSLDDRSLSAWPCSANSMFSGYPTDFQPLAVVLNGTAGGVGYHNGDIPNSRYFADGSLGLPYVIARGTMHEGAPLSGPVSGGVTMSVVTSGVVRPGVATPGIVTPNFATPIIATPIIAKPSGTVSGKCGDGVWDNDLGEECDDGNTENGDGCDMHCKCEGGLPMGDGKCMPKSSAGGYC